MCSSYVCVCVCVIWKIQEKTTLHLIQFATLALDTHTHIHPGNVLLSQYYVVNMSMSMLSEETMNNRFFLQANERNDSQCSQTKKQRKQ